jgi:tetratricopeptide (TPR) repeat protein
MNIGRGDEAIEWRERAIPLLDRYGLEDKAARSRLARAASLAARGRISLDEYRALSAELATRGDLPTYTHVVAYNSLGEVEIDVGLGPRAAFAAWATAVDISARRGHERPRMYNKGRQAEAAYQLGEWGTVLVLQEEIQVWEESSGRSLIGAMAAPWAALVHVARGDLGAADHLLTDLLPRAREVRDPEILFPALIAAAAAAFARGDEAAALGFAVEFATEREATTLDRALQTTLSRIAVAARDAALVERLAAEEDHTGPMRANVSATNSALVAQARGLYADAGRLFGEAANGWADLGCVVEQAHALVGLGRCHIALGRVTEAEAPLDEARAIFTRLGARSWLAEFESMLSAPIA